MGARGRVRDENRYEIASQNRVVWHHLPGREIWSTDLMRRWSGVHSKHGPVTVKELVVSQETSVQEMDRRWRREMAILKFIQQRPHVKL